MTKVYYAELWGPRQGKYDALLQTDVSATEWTELEPSSPFYLFVPFQQDLLGEYQAGWKVTDIFPVSSVGIVTARDHLTIGWCPEEVRDTISDFASLSPDEARERYRLGDDALDWKVSLAQKDLRDSGLRSDLIVPILYRPFDVRYTYYTGHSGGFLCRPRSEVMRHMLRRNVALLCPRRVETKRPWQHVLSAGETVEHVAVSLKTIDSVFPLYLYAAEGEMELERGRRPNLSSDFVKSVSENLALEFVADGSGDISETFGPEDVFNYAYAIFHSSTYRKRYAEFLKMDFPRLPLTSDKKLFQALSAKGAELVSLHLVESPTLNTFVTRYPVAGSNTVEKVTYDEVNGRVYINKTQYFEGVTPEIWDFHVGGYQVCQKWLKDRKGRTLSYDDLTHYQKIVVALKETIRLMEEIDQLIPGWPVE